MVTVYECVLYVSTYASVCFFVWCIGVFVVSVAIGACGPGFASNFAVVTVSFRGNGRGSAYSPSILQPRALCLVYCRTAGAWQVRCLGGRRRCSWTPVHRGMAACCVPSTASMGYAGRSGQRRYRSHGEAVQRSGGTPSRGRAHGQRGMGRLGRRRAQRGMRQGLINPMVCLVSSPCVSLKSVRATLC